MPRYIVNKLPRGCAVTLMPPSRDRLTGSIVLLVGILIASPWPAGAATSTGPAGPEASAVTPPAPTASTQAGQVTIESDRQLADNGTGVVTASGNVRIVYPDRKLLATARQAQYFSREGRVVLSGDVQVLQDDGSRLLAEQVVYDVSLERLEARPVPGAQVLSIVRLKRPQDPTRAPASLLPTPMAQPAR